MLNDEICPACSGTGEGVDGTACYLCRGRGYPLRVTLPARLDPDGNDSHDDEAAEQRRSYYNGQMGRNR